MRTGFAPFEAFRSFEFSKSAGLTLGSLEHNAVQNHKHFVKEGHQAPELLVREFSWSKEKNVLSLLGKHPEAYQLILGSELMYENGTFYSSATYYVCPDIYLFPDLKRINAIWCNASGQWTELGTCASCEYEPRTNNIF